MNILDVFYNEVAKEAIIGRINCGFTLNILFNTSIEGVELEYMNNYEDVIIPVLKINNKDLFDKLLVQYVNLASEYYQSDKYLIEVKQENMDVKFILSTLFSNATFEDFANPIAFLEKRIAFLKNSLEGTIIDFGYSETLQGNLILEIKKDLLLNETPSKMVFSLQSKENNNYYFPEVKFGLDYDTVYFYAVQTKEQEENAYIKKVNRLLYKIGEGFDAKTDNYELYEEGNLKDVTASFLAVINMAIAYLYSIGYKNIKVPSILPSRWNGKRIAIIESAKRKKEYNQEKKIKDQERIQSNLTEKFIRTFLRLGHHYEGINITALPFDVDSNLSIFLQDELICNNNLLEESFEIINQGKRTR